MNALVFHGIHIKVVEVAVEANELVLIAAME